VIKPAFHSPRYARTVSSDLLAKDSMKLDEAQCVRGQVTCQSIYFRVGKRSPSGVIRSRLLSLRTGREIHKRIFCLMKHVLF